MRKFGFASTLLPLAMLAACGGGGGVSSTPAPPAGGTPTPTGGTPTPTGGTPTPTGGTPTPSPPLSIGNLQATQVFEGTSGYIRTTFDLDTGAADTAEFANRRVQISYDADTDSYALSAGTGRNFVFSPADIVSAESGPGQTTFQRSLSSTTFERLFILTQPVEGEANRSVALAAWQSIAIDSAANTQASDVDIFVFGFETAPDRIPRTGILNYATSLYGILTYPDEEPRALVSAEPGTFTLDLTRGVFAAFNRLREFELRPGGGTIGALDFDATGTIASDANAFMGTFFYDGGGSRSFGQLEGSFFGTDAGELGAAFSGIGNNGYTLNGALTGQHDPAIGAGLALADQPLPESYIYHGTRFDSGIGGGSSSIRFSDSTVRFNGPSSITPDFEFSRLSGNSAISPGYLSWSGTEGEFDVGLALNDASGEGIELTYSNFGSASWAREGDPILSRGTIYFRYGLPTPRGVLLARTGTASYSGTIVGEAFNRDSDNRYSVDGTSTITIDFGGRTVDGNFAMTGTLSGTNVATDFGNWDLDGEISSNFGMLENLALKHESVPPDDGVGSFVNGEFYGPNAEEIGIEFETILPAGVLGEYLNVGGVMAAIQD